MVGTAESLWSASKEQRQIPNPVSLDAGRAAKFLGGKKSKQESEPDETVAVGREGAATLGGGSLPVDVTPLSLSSGRCKFLCLFFFWEMSLAILTKKSQEICFFVSLFLLGDASFNCSHMLMYLHKEI